MPSGGVLSGPMHCQEPVGGVVDRMVDKGIIWILRKGIGEKGSKPMSLFLERPSAR